MKPARGPVRWWLKLSGFKGITLPPFGIYALPDHLDNERLQRHEQEHWRQAQQYGTVGFYLRYVWYAVRHGYQNHPFEIAAQKAEQP